MNITREVAEILQYAGEFVTENGYEYVTPEALLLAMCEQENFRLAFSSCDGDVEELKRRLREYMEKYVPKKKNSTPKFSEATKKMLVYAEMHLSSCGNDTIEMKHLLRAVWQLKDGYAAYYMKLQGVDEVDMLRALAETEEAPEEESREDEEADDADAPDDAASDYDDDDADDEDDYDNDDDDDTGVQVRGRRKEARGKGSSGRNSFAPCLNDTLKDINPLIGREEELERTIQILCRKEKNNPLHIGEPGVGKTAITYGLVERIREGKVPEPLWGSRVYALDLGGAVAGTKYRGEFEKRLKKVMSEIAKDERPIVYIDEIHNLIGAGGTAEGTLDAANILKPYLAEGHIRFIGATTFEEYKKRLEKDKSIIRRFQNVEIREPDIQETVEILKGLLPGYEEFHGVSYEDEVPEYAASMSAKLIHERFLPDKAIDLIDEAGAYRRIHPLEEKKQTVGKDVVNQVLTSICRVPVETVDAEEREGLATLEQRLKARIFGQDEAVSQVVNAIKFSKAGLLDAEKPLASLLFVGPTGVGKTEIAKCLAKELGVKLIRFDMSEYMEQHTVAKFIGSPAGYVGYEEGGILTEEIRKHPSSVLLLDEIEKAHVSIFNILLQIMDYATLTDNQGRKADFRNVVIIMTSNAGAARLGKTGIGFRAQSMDESVLKDEVKNTFAPEFRNRLNKVVIFHAMDDDMGRRVVEKKLGELSDMLRLRKVEFSADEKAIALVQKKGVSVEFGAREVDRVIRNEIKPLLVDDLLFGRLKDGGKVELSAEEDEFEVR